MLDELAFTGPVDRVFLDGAESGALASPLAVTDCAIAAVAAFLTAAGELAERRTGHRPEASLDIAHVEAAMRSEVWLRDANDQHLAGFAPLSRLWECADGWVRTHANYPWHRTALLATFAIDDQPDDVAITLLRDTFAALPAADVEQAVQSAGGLAVASRTPDEWSASGPGAAVAADPLVALEPLGAAGRPLPSPGALPASGVRVLDLTRVIAGPVATRMLAAVGADVLRLDDPARPELPLHAVDGVIGKSSATLDLTSPGGLDRLHELLDEADVLVTGYRPGALARFGLTADAVCERHPSVIVASLSAWGDHGPWGGRRGFDSLAQIAVGIGTISGHGPRPGALPCQLLDHASGYLLAAGVLAALARRAADGSTSSVRVSLARTAKWLLDQGTGPGAAPDVDLAATLAEKYVVDLGDGWRGIAPPGALDAVPLAWPGGAPRYGVSPAAWPVITSR